MEVNKRKEIILFNGESTNKDQITGKGCNVRCGCKTFVPTFSTCGAFAFKSRSKFIFSFVS